MRALVSAIAPTRFPSGIYTPEDILLNIYSGVYILILSEYSTQTHARAHTRTRNPPKKNTHTMQSTKHVHALNKYILHV